MSKSEAPKPAPKPVEKTPVVRTEPPKPEVKRAINPMPVHASALPVRQPAPKPAPAPEVRATRPIAATPVAQNIPVVPVEKKELYPSAYYKEIARLKKRGELIARKKIEQSHYYLSAEITANKNSTGYDHRAAQERLRNIDLTQSLTPEEKQWLIDDREAYFDNKNILHLSLQDKYYIALARADFGGEDYSGQTYSREYIDKCFAKGEWTFNLQESGNRNITQELAPFSHEYLPTQIFSDSSAITSKIEQRNGFEVERITFGNGVLLRTHKDDYGDPLLPMSMIRGSQDAASLHCDHEGNVMNFVVADGVGGSFCGKEAANEAVFDAMKLLRNRVVGEDPQIFCTELGTQTQKSMHEAYNNILKPSWTAAVDAMSEREWMMREKVQGASGTTVMAAGFIENKTLYVSRVGDCGFMVLRKNGQLKFVSQEPAVNNQMALGRNIRGTVVVAEPYMIPLEDEDIIIVNSDGLFHSHEKRSMRGITEEVRAEEVVRMQNEGKTLQQIAEYFLDDALGGDDLTILAFTYHDQLKSTSPVETSTQARTVSNADLISADFMPGVEKPSQGLSAENRKVFDRELETLNEELKKIERGEISFESEVKKMQYIDRRCMDVHMVGVSLLPSGDTKRNYWYLHEIEQMATGQIKFRLLYEAFKRLHPGYVEEVIAGIVDVNTEEEAREVYDWASRRFEGDFYARVLRRNFIETGHQSGVPSFNVAESEEYDACRDALQFVGSTFVKQRFATAM